MNFKSFHHYLLVSLKCIIIIQFSVAFLLYFVTVFFRMTFDIIIPTPPHLLNYLFIVSALSGAIYAIHTDENITISLLQKFSKQKVPQIIIHTFSTLTSCLILVIFIHYAYFIFNTGNSYLSTLFYIYLFFISIISYLDRLLEALNQN